MDLCIAGHIQSLPIEELPVIIFRMVMLGIRRFCMGAMALSVRSEAACTC